MGIRETLNDNPKLVTRLTLGMLAFSAIYILIQIFSDRAEPRSTLRDFFTIDDGQTYFLDDATKISPFVVNGRTAYRCRVFFCGNEKPFVGYLERYPPHVIEELDRLRAAGESRQKIETYLASISVQLEYKSPAGGTGTWASMADPDAVRKILTVTCPDGRPAAQLLP